MKPYRGKIRLSCDVAMCPRGIMKDVQPECLSCSEVKAEVLNFSDTPVFALSWDSLPTGKADLSVPKGTPPELFATEED